MKHTKDPVRETVDEWLERVGYCFHSPLCQDNATCRAKRALEYAAQKPSKAYAGQSASSRKLDWDE